MKTLEQLYQMTVDADLPRDQAGFSRPSRKI